MNLQNSEYIIGYKILVDALAAPLKQIILNVGRDDASVILKGIVEGKGNSGYNAATDEMVPDMIKAGTVDPVKVTIPRDCEVWCVSILLSSFGFQKCSVVIDLGNMVRSGKLAISMYLLR